MGPYGAHLHDGSEYDGSYADTTSIQVNSQITYSLVSRKSGYEYLIIDGPLIISLFYFLCPRHWMLLGSSGAPPNRFLIK